MDDQKNTDKSSSSIELSIERSDSVSLTISERDILYERQKNEIQRKVVSDFEITSYSDDSGYY